MERQRPRESVKKQNKTLIPVPTSPALQQLNYLSVTKDFSLRGSSWVMPKYAQGPLLVGLGGPYAILGIKLGSATYKASALVLYYLSSPNQSLRNLVHFLSPKRFKSFSTMDSSLYSSGESIKCITILNSIITNYILYLYFTNSLPSFPQCLTQLDFLSFQIVFSEAIGNILLVNLSIFSISFWDHW